MHVRFVLFFFFLTKLNQSLIRNELLQICAGILFEFPAHTKRIKIPEIEGNQGIPGRVAREKTESLIRSARRHFPCHLHLLPLLSVHISEWAESVGGDHDAVYHLDRRHLANRSANRPGEG